MVIKSPGEIHFTRDFGGGAKSARVILPSQDGTNVKVTRFAAPRGFVAKNVTYPNVDETVYVISGHVRLTVAGQTPVLVKSGGVYHVSAGEVYEIEVMVDCELLCMFSPMPGGPLPDDE